MKIGVLADDLTGAADAALAFERAGFLTEITLWGARRPAGNPGVWVLDTGSRGMTGPVARRRARAAAGRLKGWKAGFIFKKIDSTLRGPVGPELDGLLDAAGAPPGGLAFVPAFPVLGRTTSGGRHFVGGVPLHETAFGKDPRHPLSTDVLAEIVGVGRGGRGAGGLWIPDVPDEAALRRAARETLKRGARAAAGSAGFAAALAALLGRSARVRPRRLVFGGAGGKAGPMVKTALRLAWDDGGGRARVLLVSGSAHPVARRQLASFIGDARVISAPARRGDPAKTLRALVARARRALGGGKAFRVAVAGGETAAALARATGTARWRVLAEVERGVPLLAAAGRRRRSWWVMKPGGFGREDLWTRAISLLSMT